MTKTEATQYFGTQEKLAAALGIRREAVAQWPERVPSLRQLQLERMTEGMLRADKRAIGAGWFRIATATEKPTPEPAESPTAHELAKLVVKPTPQAPGGAGARLAMLAGQFSPRLKPGPIVSIAQEPPAMPTPKPPEPPDVPIAKPKGNGFSRDDDWKLYEAGIMAKAKALHVEPQPGDTWRMLIDRIEAAESSKLTVDNSQE